MLLARVATVRLMGPAPSAVTRGQHTASNGVVVQVTDVDYEGRDEAAPHEGHVVLFPHGTEQTRVVVTALVDAGAPRLDRDRVVIEPGPRAAAEAAILEFADLLAVAHQCRRIIRSPQGCVALGPGGTGGPPPGTAKGLTTGHFSSGRARVLRPNTDPQQLARAVAGRQDGAGMLADALSEDSAIARVREYFRLFERAFKRGPSALVAPLVTFLASEPRHDASAYEDTEVREWMEQLRPAAVHGDRREYFARSADAAPYLARMEFAAYDVLLNKAAWRDPSAARRNRVFFVSVPSPQAGGATLLDPSAHILLDWLDPFGVYPKDGNALARAPAGWLEMFEPQETQQT